MLKTHKAYETLKTLILATAKSLSLNNLLEFKTSGDGRLVSAIMETAYLDKLEELLIKKDKSINIWRPPARHWFDIMINNIPINLKLTTGGTDNAFNKTAITYTLLDGITNDAKIVGFSEWYEFIKANYNSAINRNPFKEYHYLVINKNNPSKVLFKSILDINTYRSNPSNILQIRWKHEFNHYTYVLKTAESYQLKKLELLKCIQVSLVKEYKSKRSFIDANLDTDILQCRKGKRRKTM